MLQFWWGHDDRFSASKLITTELRVGELLELRECYQPCSAGRHVRTCLNYTPHLDSKRRFYPLIRRIERLRQHARFGDRGHEAAVSGPARQNMHVDMAGDARARRFAPVHPHHYT